MKRNLFTVNLAERKRTLLVDYDNDLRSIIKKAQTSHPFHIDAWVVLPDHTHCIWILPKEDDDFSCHWKMIKTTFSKGLPRKKSDPRQ